MCRSFDKRADGIVPYLLCGIPRQFLGAQSCVVMSRCIMNGRPGRRLGSVRRYLARGRGPFSSLTATVVETTYYTLHHELLYVSLEIPLLTEQSSNALTFLANTIFIEQSPHNLSTTHNCQCGRSAWDSCQEVAVEFPGSR